MAAYLDGGTMSMFVAVFATGVAGLGVYTRRFWHRMVKRTSKDPPTEDSPTE